MKRAKEAPDTAGSLGAVEKPLGRGTSGQGETLASGLLGANFGTNILLLLLLLLLKLLEKLLPFRRLLLLLLSTNLRLGVTVERMVTLLISALFAVASAPLVCTAGILDAELEGRRVAGYLPLAVGTTRALRTGRLRPGWIGGVDAVGTPGETSGGGAPSPSAAV